MVTTWLGGNLYIVMEYIEGLSLLELCNSLKEKKKSFSEQRIWKMFTQVSNVLYSIAIALLTTITVVTIIPLLHRVTITVVTVSMSCY